MKAKIGITGNIITYKRPEEVAAFDANYTPREFSQAVELAGGIPYIIPIMDESLAEEIMSSLDGLILTGGQDVSPLLYNQEPHQAIQETSPQRDTFELSLINAAIHQGKAILGICRGLQLLNVRYGGTLYQDLSEDKTAYLQHNQQSLPQFPTHRIQIKDQSSLSPIFGKEITVNSFHHQAIDQLGQGLTVIAQSLDQVIEAVEAPADNVIAVQWHPELTHIHDQHSINLFRNLVERALPKD